MFLLRACQMLSMLCCLSVGASEAIAVVRANDGSAAANAFKAAEKQLTDMAQQPMTVELPPEIAGVSKTMVITAATADAVPDGAHFKGFNADWIIQLKSAGKPGCTESRSMYAREGATIYEFARVIGAGGHDWVAVRIINDSTPHPLLCELNEVREKLKAAGVPLTAAQEDALQTICGELINAWKVVQGAPSDLTQAAKMADLLTKTLDAQKFEYIVPDGVAKVLTSAQLALLKAPQFELPAMDSQPLTGEGSYGVSTTASKGKVVVTITISDMGAETAFKAVAKTVGNAFRTTVSVPAISPEFAKLKVNTKLVIDDATTAMAKLANALGLTIKTVDNNAVLVR